MATTRLQGRGVLAARARVNPDGPLRTVPDRVKVGRFHFAFEDDIAGRFSVYLRRARFECCLRVRHRPGFID